MKSQLFENYEKLKPAEKKLLEAGIYSYDSDSGVSDHELEECVDNVISLTHQALNEASEFRQKLG